MSHRAAALALASFSALTLLAVPAAAQDIFEIQVYDSQTAAPGQVGAELHVNHVFKGSAASEGPELPTDGTTHLTLEPHVGIAEWCEAGVYLLTAFREGGGFDVVGAKARFKARLPLKLWGVVGLALNQELSAVRPEYEAGRFGWEIRPVVDLEWDRLYFSANPILSVPLGGPGAWVVDFEPALKASVRVAPFLSAGAEYYAGLGPLAGFEPLSAQVHRLFGVLDFGFESGRKLIDLNLGVGYGLGGAEQWIAKAIVTVDLEPAERPREGDARGSGAPAESARRSP
jgi:hypothetical protein